MFNRLIQRTLIVMSIVGVVGCAGFSHQIPQGEKPIQKIPPWPPDVSGLAGLWEYEEKTGWYTITLDEEGKGAYDWEDGWFETLEFNQERWKGKWIQTGNDREGGFELTLSDDSPVARGNWWYTRIGNDEAPLEPGGTFTMTRPSSPLIGEK